MSEDANKANDQAVTVLMDLALHITAACRPDMPIRHDTLVSISGRSLASRLKHAMPLHDASHQTVMIRAGFGLGLLQAASTRNASRVSSITGPAVGKF